MKAPIAKHRWTFSTVWIETPSMIRLSLPFTEEKIRALKVGDEVLISGIVFTGREMRVETNWIYGRLKL